jgi:hypothetical protein
MKHVTIPSYFAELLANLSNCKNCQERRDMLMKLLPQKAVQKIKQTAMKLNDRPGRRR